MIWIDPYLVQGERLYLDGSSYDDHKELAARLRAANLPWFMTYDADERIPQELYAGLRCASFDIAHTAATQHIGSEYAVFAAGINIPDLEIIRGNTARWVA